MIVSAVYNLTMPDTPLIKLGRLGSILGALSLACVLGVNSYYAYWGTVYSQATRYYLQNDPMTALRANLMAIEVYPLDFWPRNQLILSMSAVWEAYSDVLIVIPEADFEEIPGKLIITLESMDDVYALAASAIPHNAAILYRRAEFLMNTGQASSPECVQLMNTLRDKVQLRPETWAILAWHAVLTEDEDQFNQSILTLLNTPGGEELALRQGFVE